MSLIFTTFIVFSIRRSKHCSIDAHSHMWRLIPQTTTRAANRGALLKNGITHNVPPEKCFPKINANAVTVGMCFSNRWRIGLIQYLSNDARYRLVSKGTYRKQPTASLMAMRPMTSRDLNWWQLWWSLCHCWQRSERFPLLQKNVKYTIDCGDGTDTSFDRTLLQRMAQLENSGRLCFAMIMLLLFSIFPRNVVVSRRA